MNESKIYSSLHGAAPKESRTLEGLNSGWRGPGLSQYASIPPIGLRLNRKQIRYLPMSGKPFQSKNVNLNKSLGNLASIYCDPSNLAGSTLSLPTTSFIDPMHKNTPSQRLTKMCQGFVNYDLTLACLTSIDITKPLDEAAFITVGRILLNAGANMVATCLAIETASILTLNWLPTSEDGILLPSDGYSLLLWPAANGYRKDLFNRDRFLSLFLTASIVIPKDVDIKAAMLSLWTDVIEKLVIHHKDYFTANALANGMCADQVRSFPSSRFVFSTSCNFFLVVFW
ncbi:unnamed protein product [Hydatigera taeniaeformis]|uniref:Uncharacterized protein n=1 Tax=Hydatigena taeniaeformis TaxID=6205 RepID=A0A0R3WV49_HYDTA|nr:unnamed protein product [Hydatigera taeniaeformis]